MKHKNIAFLMNKFKISPFLMNKNAGRFIGTLERIIMTIFISINQYNHCDDIQWSRYKSCLSIKILRGERFVRSSYANKKTATDGMAVFCTHILYLLSNSVYGFC